MSQVAEYYELPQTDVYFYHIQNLFLAGEVSCKNIFQLVATKSMRSRSIGFLYCHSVRIKYDALVMGYVEFCFT